jgi:DNA-binding CsgD family transcriptional regulator
MPRRPMVVFMTIELSVPQSAADFSDLDWAFALANELRPLTPRSPARHARLAAALARRLGGCCENLLFRCTTLGDIDAMHALTHATPAAASQLETLRRSLADVVMSDGLSQPIESSRLIDVLPIAPTRYAALVLTRGSNEPGFCEADRRVLQETHRGCAWIYDGYVAPTATVLARLSPRERQTLDHLLAGASEKEVAFSIGLSRHTVHAYVKRLYRTLGVNSRGELLSIFVDARPPIGRPTDLA